MHEKDFAKPISRYSLYYVTLSVLCSQLGLNERDALCSLSAASRRIIGDAHLRNVALKLRDGLLEQLLLKLGKLRNGVDLLDTVGLRIDISIDE